MWRDKQIKFLTENKFDITQIINVLKQDYSKLENNSDRKGKFFFIEHTRNSIFNEKPSNKMDVLFNSPI